jgi:hypothetical protein
MVPKKKGEGGQKRRYTEMKKERLNCQSLIRSMQNSPVAVYIKASNLALLNTKLKEE